MEEKMIHPAIKIKLENFNEYLNQHGTSFTNSPIRIEEILKELGENKKY
jgi:hypothetical protein